MTYTNEQLIEELGLQDATPEIQNQMVDIFYSTLNMRTAMILSDKLSDEQLEQFNSLTESNDDAAAEWVEQNIPEHKEIIETEMKAIIDETKTSVQNMTKNL
jgi:succinate dehydrogenase flavin-adding protein (antitoxin of CptAB toxin-antitoxin module)